MISLGQLLARACAALWRRRFAVLDLGLAWLAFDGLLLGYLSTLQPALTLVLPREVLELAYGHGFLPDVFQTLLQLPLQYAHDVVRAVFAVLLLRALLAPPTGTGEQAQAGLIVPILLILVFELAWTTALFPIDHGFTLMAVRAEAGGTIEAATVAIAAQLAKALIFACHALAMSKLCFAYPNAVLRRGLRLRQSWRETGGLAGRLFLLFLVIPILFFVLRAVLMMLVFQHEFMHETYTHLQLSLQVMESVQEIPAAVLTLAVIAVAYVAATGHAAAAISGTERSPRQLAEAFE